ncbi:hypothetical protein BGZ59_007829 [Podila verticillata]|nr:hypothetical protein BGZ59_007829 [Podila verticillata]KAI9236211.1 MAG: dynein associated protein-domain-containing protein [Podila humilis]KFH70935.1 hypothetical protein MVEG_03781 [Podila verticillata NRRL 6337]
MADPGSSMDIEVGARVEYNGILGYVRYAGQTSFAPGKWVGIELDLPRGKNAGVVEGKRYFDCKAVHGVFVRPNQVKIVMDGDTQAPETHGRTSRPVSISSQAGLSSSRMSTPSRPSSMRTPATPTVGSPTASSRLSRPPARSRPTSTIDTSTPEPTRRIRVPQTTREDDTVAADRSHSNTPTSARGPQQLPQLQQQQLQLQQQQEALMAEEERELVIAQESLIQQELEHEEALALQQQQQNQQGFAPLSASASSSGIAALAGGAGGQAQRENTVAMKDYEELRIKLRILEAKRGEDRERIREAEKAKEESEQFLSIRTKLQAKLTEMQQELRDAKRSLKDAVTEKDAFESKYNDVLETMEVTMLDKEMAEEKAENLQYEVDMLKEKVEEINVDLHVFQQEEANLANRDRPAVGQLQLEKQNERLTEALRRLRDVTTEQEAELTRKLKNLEKEVSLLHEVQAQSEKLKESLELAENQIEDLKTRLDDAVGAEDMIEQLSEKNIALGEKIEEMQSTIVDLEALKELNDELEENHSETEKQLQAEINIKDNQLKEHLKRIETLEENIGDYENTIIQFRELVAHLQGDIEQLRQKEESKAQGNGGLGSQSQAMLSLNLQLQSTAMKAQAKAIDLELRKLEAMQANDNLTLVQPYLPDGFFRTENDSIQCLLLFKRLSFKSDLVNKHLEQQYNIAEKITQNSIPSELVPICEMRQKLAWFGDMAKRFVSYIEGCPVEVFAKMGPVYHDLVGTERRLNTWMDLLRKEELKESDCIVDLQRAISQLDHLAESFLSNTKLDLADRYQGVARALDYNLDRMFVNLTSVASFFKSNEDGVRVVDTDDIQYQIIHSVTNLGAQVKTGKATTRKLLRKLDELSSQSSVIKPECFSQYRNACMASTKLGDFTHEAVQCVAQYTRARREGTKTESIHQTIYNVTDTHLGIGETGMWDGCRKMLNGLLQDLAALAENVLDPEVTIKVAKPDKVWIKRAKEMKAEVIVNVDAEQKAQSLQDQVLKLVKEAKLKDQALQESGVKIELLGKRMENFKKQAEQISFLDRDIDKARKQERDFEEAIVALQAEVETVETENTQLKRLLRKYEGRGMAAPIKRPTHQHSGSILDNDSSGSLNLEGADVGSNRDLLIQIDSLKSALRYLRSENSSLRTRAALQDLGLTPDASALSAPLGRVDGKSKLIDSSEGTGKRSADTELKAVALETKRLIKDARLICASPKIVDLTKHTTSSAPVSTPETPRRHWQAQQSRPEWQYHTQQAALTTIQQRSNELKERLAKFSRSTAVPAPSKLKKLTLAEVPIGRVHFPKSMSALVGVPEGAQGPARKDLAVYLRSSAEFEAMHQLFVR